MSDGQLRLFGVGEAAACMGISTQRLLVLRKRPGFPAPFAVLRCGIIWLASDIEAYDASRNKTSGPARRTE